MNKEEKLKKEQKAKEINKLKGLRITLIVFIIILLSLISFVGIYVKDKNEMSDVIPDFILGSDIEGNRIIQLNVEQDETITLTDSTGAIRNRRRAFKPRLYRRCYYKKWLYKIIRGNK